MVWHVNTIAIEIVVPMHTKQVARVGGIFVDTLCDVLRDQSWLCQFTKSWEHNLLCCETLHTALKRVGVHHGLGQTKLLLQCGGIESEVERSCVSNCHGSSLPPLTPITSTSWLYPCHIAGVAQLAEAAVLGTACWGFESLHRHNAHKRPSHPSSCHRYCRLA